MTEQKQVLDQDVIDRLTMPEDQQTPENALSDNEIAAPGLMEALIEEIKDAGARAMELKDKIDNAKTTTKAELYRKKLAKNSEDAVPLIVALDRVTKVREARERVSDDSGDVVETSSRKESIN